MESPKSTTTCESSTSKHVTIALRREIANFLHYLVIAVREGRVHNPDEAKNSLVEPWTRVANFVKLPRLDVISTAQFSGELHIG